MSELTPLREAVDRIVDGAAPLDLGAIERRAARRRRRRTTGLAAGAVAAAAVALVVVPRLADDQRSSSLSPVMDERAAEMVVDGELGSYAATDDALVGRWQTCLLNCEAAWGLVTDAGLTAAGMFDGDMTQPIMRTNGEDVVVADASGDHGFLIHPDGSVTPLEPECTEEWPTDVAPGRHVLLQADEATLIVDTDNATLCELPRIGSEPIIQSGTFSDDGTLWAVVNPIPGAQLPKLSIGRWDGREWTYHDLGIVDPIGTKLAASGDTVTVVTGQDETRVAGLLTTTDGGRTWSELGVMDIPFGPYESQALTADGTLFVADSGGALWRSTDLASFARVATSGTVSSLMPAGDSVIGRTDAGPVRIADDGAVTEVDLP